VEEVEQVGNGRAEPLDLQPVDRVDVVDDLLGGVAARAVVEQPAERALVLGAFVDVGDAQLRLPQEGVLRTLKDLTLLGDRMDDGLERRPAIGDAERARRDLRYNLLKAAADRAEVLDALVPQEPRAVGGAGIVAQRRISSRTSPVRSCAGIACAVVAILPPSALAFRLARLGRRFERHRARPGSTSIRSAGG
jgi:hypothetical protein